MVRVSPIRLSRLAQGLSLDEVASRVGCSSALLSLVERGQKRLRPGLARRVSTALGLPLSYVQPITDGKRRSRAGKE